MLSMAEGLAVKRRAQSRLFAIPGVHSVGFGAKVTAGKPAGEFAILVFVAQKKPAAELPPDEMIPAEIEGLKTDVVECSPEIIRISETLQGGDEIDVNGQGTLGCVARLHAPDMSPPDVLLSCRHVLYPDANTQPGAKVRIPCCCCCHKDVGTVLDGPKINDLIDAALGQFDAGVQTKAQLHNVPVKGILDLINPTDPQVVQALQNQTFRVFKYGSRTNLSRGKVISNDQDISDIPPGVASPRTNQIVVQPLDREEFGKEGDSGSAVYDENNRIIGILWGVHKTGLGLVSHIKHVLDAFPGLRIATNPPEVVYVTPGISRVPPALGRIHRDLTASGCMEYYARLYGNHLEEVRWLFAHNRHFVSAWHRNHGPIIAQALTHLAEGRIASLPTAFEGQSWKACTNRIAGALLYAGSERLQADVGRYRSFIGALGGNSYADILQLMRALARTN